MWLSKLIAYVRGVTQNYMPEKEEQEQEMNLQGNKSPPRLWLEKWSHYSITGYITQEIPFGTGIEYMSVEEHNYLMKENE